MLSMDARKMVFGLLMMKYGNGGSCCSADNHSFMKALYEGREEEAENLIHRVTDECKRAYERVNDGDLRELTEAQQKRIVERERWAGIVGVNGEEDENTG